MNHNYVSTLVVYRRMYLNVLFGKFQKIHLKYSFYQLKMTQCSQNKYKITIFSALQGA